MGTPPLLAAIALAQLSNIMGELHCYCIRPLTMYTCLPAGRKLALRVQDLIR